MTDIIQAKKTAPLGYHYTNAGILPNEWTSRPLSSIVEEITETAGTRKIETVSISAGVGFVNQAEKFGKELSGKQYEKYTVLHRGDFSYNKGNSNLYPQGCIYRLNDRTEAAVPNVFESFRVCDGNPDFYEQLFISGFLNKQLYSRINRGVRDDGLLNLRGKDFYSCEVPCPPLAEQERIAEILMQCDKVIELKQKKICELKQFKKECLRRMFPAKGYDKPDIRFPGFTDAWEQRKLGEYVSITSGEAPSKFEEGTELYVKVDDLNYNDKYVVDTQNRVAEHSTVKRVTKGSVVFPKRGAAIMTNKVRIMGIDSYMDTNMMALTSEKLDSEFLYNIISKEGLYKIADTSTIPQINNKHIEPYEVTIPSLDEQRRIGAYFSNLDHLITLHQRELEESKKKKKALAQVLLLGVVRIRI